MTKKEAFEILLREGHVLIWLFYDSLGVVLPPVCDNRTLMVGGVESHQKMIALEYGLSMPVPISDLVVMDAGVSAVLSFNRTPHKTFVPWTAVAFMENDEVRIDWKTPLSGAQLPLPFDGEHNKKPSLSLV